MKFKNTSKKIHEAKYFTVLADKTKETTKREKLSIAFRYAHGFKIVERFSGYCYNVVYNGLVILSFSYY